MRTILKILWVEVTPKFTRTHAIVTDLMGNEEESVGYGDGFKVGDKVEYFFDSKWGVAKMRKPIDVT